MLGWSLGAPHALAVAYGLPDRVTRTATVGAPAPLDEPGAKKQVGFLTDRVLGGLSNSAPWLAGVAFSSIRLAPAPLVKWHLLSECSPADKAVVSRLTTRKATGYFFESLRRGPAGEIEEYKVMYAPWGFAPEQIRGEVQLWHGADDALCLPVNAEQLAARIPRATLTMVPAAGHFLLHTKAAEIFDGLTGRS